MKRDLAGAIGDESRKPGGRNRFPVPVSGRGRMLYVDLEDWPVEFVDLDEH